MSGPDGVSGEQVSPDALDDELLEAAAGAEQGFDAGPSGDGDLVDLAALVAERDEYRDTMLRLKAEFDNHRKRVAREADELRARANENLAEKLILVLDACDAAIGHGATDVEPIAKMLVDLLEADGLVRLAPLDEPFDPNLHEAVLHEEGDGGESIVVETLRTGYQWKSRVLRPAMVKVRG
jgi:molecular chaperone GrpE